MERNTCASHRAALVGLALIGLACGCATGCATGNAVVQDQVQKSRPKIQLLFSARNGTTVWECKTGRKPCTKEPGNFTGHTTDFQRSGTTIIEIDADECLDSFRLIQIEDINGAPFARVVCAQQAE